MFILLRFFEINVFLVSLYHFIEYNDLFEENPINQNNLNTSKNFIISCYNQFSTNYDTKLKEKVKTLTNLAGDIEIFEL